MASLFSRALAGAGKEAGVLANQYITEELAQGRARFHAELQRTTANAMRADEDAFRNEPARIERDRANRVADATAMGQVQNQVALEGERAKATDTELQSALTKNEVDRKTATTQAETDLLVKRMNDPAYVAGLRKQAQATHIESAGSAAQAALARAQLDQIKTIGDLKTQLQQAVATGDKAGEQSLREQLGVWTDKAGKVEKARDSIIAAQRAMLGAQKVLSDREASPDSKAEAEQTLRELRATAAAAAREAGIDLPSVPDKEIPPGAIEMLRKDPKLTSFFDAKYGPGAAQRVLGAQAPVRPATPLMERAASQAQKPPSIDAEIQAAMKPVQTDFAARQAIRTKAASDPDLLALDARRAQLLRAGRAREANAVIDQMNTLRTQRYGL